MTEAPTRPDDGIVEKAITFFYNFGNSTLKSGVFTLSKLEQGVLSGNVMTPSKVINLGPSGTTYWRDIAPSTITAVSTPVANLTLDKVHISNIIFLMMIILF